MILTIARKEWTDLRRDGRFRAAAALVFLLATVGLVAGALHLGTLRAEREEGRRLTRQQWLEQGEKNPHSAAHYGIWAFKPESPLAVFDRGVEAYLGVAVYLEAHKQNPTRYRPAADATAAAHFGELTGASGSPVRRTRSSRRRTTRHRPGRAPSSPSRWETGSSSPWPPCPRAR